MISLSWQVVVAAIAAPAVVMIALIFFIRDLIQARDLRERDSYRSQESSFNNGAKAVLQLVPEIHKQLMHETISNDSTKGQE